MFLERPITDRDSPGAVAFAPDLGRYSHRWLNIVNAIVSSSPDDVPGLLQQHLRAYLAKGAKRRNAAKSF